MATAKKDATGNRVQGHRGPRDGSPQVLLPIEAAELLRVSVDQLYHLTSKKKVPFTKVGGALRFDRVRLLDFIANGGSVGTSSAGTGSRKAAGRGSNRRNHRAGSHKTADRRFTFNTPPRSASEK